ncbi:MAG TPA: RusA family crossover junction endodeoxyribonuclease [Polyangiaceae bacterium]|nr:RusA family crossover junction endodeoxyribonuclease [Polyangiaceae bacterium]
MSDELHFVVAGPPQPKQRARQGKGGHWYTPSETRAYEVAVKVAALAAMMQGGHPRDDRKSTFAAFLDVYFGDERGRDVDNVAKAILDAANKIVWHDDRQVHELAVRRFVDRARPRVEVRVRRLGQVPEQLSLVRES